MLIPNASTIRLIRYIAYVANPDITKWLQSQASLFSRLYFEPYAAASWIIRAQGAAQSTALTNQTKKLYNIPRSSFSWSIIAATAEYSSTRSLLHIPTKMWMSLFLYRKTFFFFKCSFISLSYQWILCSVWVPSEWESKQLIKTSQ